MERFYRQVLAAVKRFGSQAIYPNVLGDTFRGIIHTRQSVLAFMIAGEMSDAINKVEEKEKVIQDIKAKITKLNDTALGTIEKVSSNLASNSQSLGTTRDGVLAETKSLNQKFFAKNIIDGPEGVDCSKNIKPDECRETMKAIDTNLSNTFSDANIGFVNKSIDNLKLNASTSGLLKGGLSSLKSVAFGLSGKNAISLGNKFNNDYDNKKITPFRDAALKELNAKLEKQGKKPIDLEAGVKKNLGDLNKAMSGVTPGGAALASAGGLKSGTSASVGVNNPAQDLNRVDAPAMTVSTEVAAEESSGDFSASTDTEEQLPSTPKVFTEKSFDNFVNEIKEKKHDRGDNDSIFSIVNKAYKRNAYPVLLRPKKEKIKVPVPPPQT
ncbi:MAG: hypothetical protein U0T83_07420 [Bacteriovoracaceae bacterium]